MTSLSFTEKMKGYLCPEKRDFESHFNLSEFQSYAKNGNKFEFIVTIEIDDIDLFCEDPEFTAKIKGEINSSQYGEGLVIKSGTFNLFVRPDSSEKFNTAKEMHYTLYFHDKDGVPFTFYGFKEIEREDGLDVWHETTTLYSYIFEGHTSFMNDGKKMVGAGILNISIADFAKQMTTFQSADENLVGKSRAILKFVRLFSGNLWEAYAPFFFGTDDERWNEHIYPIGSLEGVHSCEKTLIPFSTDDGLGLTIQRFKRRKSKNVILLLHGLTTSTDMFIMPEHYNLVQYLLNNDFGDVWSLDWRGSNRFKYNLEPHRYTIDDIAKFDIPKALEVMRDEVGDDVKIHVIAHCVGSLSLMCSVASGASTNIASIISNSVSLTPKVPLMSKLKLKFAPFIIEYILRYPYLSPMMPYYPGPGFGKWLYWMERLFRRECKEPACHMVSFMWGWGFPAAYVHENLNPITHRRLKDLFGGTSVHYYRHIYKMLKEGEAIPYKHEGIYHSLPSSYLENIENIKLPPTLLISGKENIIFPKSNKLTFEKIKKINPSINISYQEFKGYGHQDIFMGKNCDRDIFPALLQFLREHKK